MRGTVFQLLVTILLCTSAAASAQQRVEKTSSQPDKKSKQQSPEHRSSTVTRPRPSPEIERLVKAFSGTWSIAIKIEPNETMPKGGRGQGEETWRPGPGGLSLIEDYRSTGDEGELSGLGVAWWDKDARRYQVMWCDSTNRVGCIVMKHGAKWEGNQVVAMDVSESAGKKLTFKEVFSDIKENSFTQALYQGESGGDLKQRLTILATRKNAPPVPHADVQTPESVTSQAQSLKMPGPDVQNNMLGTWSIRVKYEPSAQMPNGGTGDGTEVWRPGPGGNSVIEEYYQSDANEHREEFSPAWWDEQAGGQRFVFCANSVPDGCLLSKNVAKWEGESLVYSEEREEAGRKIIASEVFTDITPSSFTQISKQGDSAKSLKPTMVIRARKVVPPPLAPHK
jgi:hypothetical protein